ncbi:MAG TPA: hypothetical protein VMF52_02965 [Steroidobacteraceae bacterium]|nr:hypothetical protein [Steroidobacteraceae bacterium]
MNKRLRYRKKPDQAVTAIRLDVETAGLRYRKWGANQKAKRGDWLVDNDGDVYSVDARSFARTYRKVAPGRYVKKTPVWAELATSAGRIATKEGSTNYRRGDYVVYNERRGGDGYAIAAAKFRAMYQRA